MNDNKEFDKIVKDLEEKFGAHILWTLDSDIIKCSVNCGKDVFLALYFLSKAKSTINKKIEELVNLGKEEDDNKED